MNKAVTTATCIMAIAALGASAQASAQGFYIGASALQSRFDADDFDIDDVDEEDTGWKLFAGFRATPNFGIEAAYTRFGEAEAPAVEVGGPFEAQAEAFSLFGVGAIPLGRSSCSRKWAPPASNRAAMSVRCSSTRTRSSWPTASARN